MAAKPIPATFVSATSFTVATDRTAEFVAGVRVLADCGAEGTFFGTVTTSSYASSTDSTMVTLSLDSGTLTANLTGVLHGNDMPSSLVNHGHTDQATGGNLFASSSQAVAGTITTLANTPAAARQAVLSWMRDTLGKFPGITPPSLNLFCDDATSDTAPVGTFTRSTTGTRLGQAGLIETVAAGSIRREWGPDGAVRGWLIEASATNLLKYSEQFDNAVWVKTRASVTANAAVAPDGTMTADKISESTDTNSHFINQSVVVTNPTSYALSVFLKGAERTVCDIITASGNGTYSAISVNLSALTIGAPKTVGIPSAAGSSSIAAVRDGWCRVSMQFIGSTTGFSGCQIRLTDGSTDAYAGDGTSGIYVWGAQIESGLFSTSYIPATSTNVVRSADAWTLPLATSWFQASAGTMFAAGRTAHGAPATGAVQVLAQYDDDSASNRIRLVRDENRLLRCLVTTAGTEAADLHLGTVADTVTFRVAFLWSSSGFSASLNGGTCVTAPAATLPSNLTTHRIGSDSARSSQWSGHVLHDVYFPVVLSDMQLQAITL